MEKLRELWKDDPVMISLSSVFLVSILLVSTLTYLQYTTYQRLMTDCLADGHKSYQCVGILKGLYR